jgi:hypothetical protein
VRERIRQLRQAWGQLTEIDPRASVLVLTGALVGLLVGVGLGLVMPLLHPVVGMVIFGLLFAFMGGMFVFNRRLQKAQYTAIEGHPGAAAAILDQMRGQWFVSPAVAVTAKQDMVHRVIGRPGVILVGEGAPQRVKGLLAKERKRLNKLVGDVPVNSVLVGEKEGQVPLRKLQMHLSKLPREMKKTEVPKLERKLKPLDKAPPIPRGIDPNMARKPRPKPR